MNFGWFGYYYTPGFNALADTAGPDFKALADGKTVLKSGVGGTGPLFPVSDQSRYSFYCKGSAYEIKREFGSATVTFYDEKGAGLSTTHLFWAEAMQTGATKAGIQPPPGATQARVNLRRVIFEELRVTKDK